MIVQPAAKDAVGEMGVREDLPRAGHDKRSTWIRDSRNDAPGVERAKVHVKALYFPTPVTVTQPAFRTVAHRPTHINGVMTEALGNRERKVRPTDCARSLEIYLAVG